MKKKVDPVAAYMMTLDDCRDAVWIAMKAFDYAAAVRALDAAIKVIEANPTFVGHVDWDIKHLIRLAGLCERYSTGEQQVDSGVMRERLEALRKASIN